MVDQSDLKIIKRIWIVIAAFCAFRGSVTTTGNFLTGYQQNVNYLFFFWEWGCLVAMGECCIGCCFRRG